MKTSNWIYRVKKHTSRLIAEGIKRVLRTDMSSKPESRMQMSFTRAQMAAWLVGLNATVGSSSSILIRILTNPWEQTAFPSMLVTELTQGITGTNIRARIIGGIRTRKSSGGAIVPCGRRGPARNKCIIGHLATSVHP